MAATFVVKPQGFNQEELEGEKAKPQASKAIAADDSDSDEGVDRGGREWVNSAICPFSLGMCEKKVGRYILAEQWLTDLLTLVSNL